MTFTGEGPLACARAVERDPRHGYVVFETGRPVRFTSLRNREPAPNLGARFGQDLEPVGRYVLHAPAVLGPPLAGWETADVSLEHPLVLELTLDGDIYGPMGWKARLVRETGKKGRALTRALCALGYDAVVTVHLGETREIVVFTAR